MRPGGTCKIKQNLSLVVLGEDDIQLNSTMGVKKEPNITVKKKMKRQKRMEEKHLKPFLVVY